MKKLMIALTFLSFNSYAGPVWLTMGASVLSQIKADLPSGSVVHSEGDVAGIIQVDAADVSKISGTIHNNLHRCGGFASFETKTEALGSIKRLAFWNRNKNVAHASYEIKAKELLHPIVQKVSGIQILSTIESLSNFQTRHYQSAEGKKAAEMIRDGWAKMSASRSDISD